MEDLKLPATLREALIPFLPGSGYYIPNFITPMEEEYLLQKVRCVLLHVSLNLLMDRID